MNMIKLGHYIRVNDVMLDTLVSTNYTSYTASVLCYLLNELSIRYHTNCTKDGYLFREDRTITITQQEASKMLRYNVCSNGSKYIDKDNIQDLKSEVFTQGQRDESIVSRDDLDKVRNELQNNIFSYICATPDGELKIYVFSIIYCPRNADEILVTFNADFIEMYFGVLTATGEGSDKYSKLSVDVMVSMNRKRSQMLFGFLTRYQAQLDKYGTTNWNGIRQLKIILGIDNDIRTGELIATTDNALKDINNCMQTRIVDGVYRQYNIEYKKLDNTKKTSPYSYFRVTQTITEPTDKPKKSKKPKKTKKSTKDSKPKESKKEQTTKKRHNYFGDME